MAMELSRHRAHRAWRSAERIKRVSDKLIGIGPFGLGLDGIIAWIPGANAVYSVGAASLLLYEAAAAGASRVRASPERAVALAITATATHAAAAISVTAGRRIRRDGRPAATVTG